MTPGALSHEPSNHEAPPDIKEEWFVASTVPFGQSIEVLDIVTGATIISVKQGWHGDSGSQTIELLLAGTPEQLHAAQERFQLEPLVKPQFN